MKRPLFSCVVPVKGARPYMKDALDSLHMQGMGDDLEIIVQDADVEPDSGQSDALNKGFAKANGEWLFWLNADDVLLPGALRKVQDCITQRGAGVEWIAGDTVYLNPDGCAMDVRTDAIWRPWFGRYMSVWTGGPSAFFRRDLWSRLGGFDVGLHYVMDIDVWTRWARSGVRFTGIGSYLWGFRMHEGSKTMGGMHDSAHLSERMRVLERHGAPNQAFWRNLTRFGCIADGSWFKRMRDKRRVRGIHWKDLQP